MSVFDGRAERDRQKRFVQVVQRDGTFRFEEGFEGQRRLGGGEAHHTPRGSVTTDLAIDSRNGTRRRRGGDAGDETPPPRRAPARRGAALEHTSHGTGSATGPASPDLMAGRTRATSPGAASHLLRARRPPATDGDGCRRTGDLCVRSVVFEHYRTFERQMEK